MCYTAMRMGLSFVAGVIATTAIYGQCFAAQIGYGEEPDLEFPPRDLHRQYALSFPFLYKEYYRVLPDKPPISPSGEENDLPKTPESPSTYSPQHSTEEHSCEHSESSTERHHLLEEFYNKSTPIDITYKQLYLSKGIYDKRPEKLSSKQPGADASVSLVMSIFEFLFSNLPRFPQTDTSEYLPRRNTESPATDLSDKQQSLFEDPSHKQSEPDTEQITPASLLVTLADKTRSYPKELSSKHPIPLNFRRSSLDWFKPSQRKFLFRFLPSSAPANHPDETQSLPEDLNRKDLESDELIPRSWESSPISPSERNISPSREHLGKSPESTQVSPSNGMNYEQGLSRIHPTFSLTDASGMKHFLAKPPTYLAINSFGREQSFPEEVHSKPTESTSVNPPGSLGLLDGIEDPEDQRALENEILEPLDGEPGNESASQDRPQKVLEKREKQNANCSTCKPFKTSYWQDPPI